jgi:L-asparaginase
MIQLILTGGTIDKTYLPEQGELGFSSSIVPQLLQEARADLEFDTRTPFMIDSLDMKDQHREKVLGNILSHPSHQALVTHGTDTMVETGTFLERELPLKHTKVIVLVGAMIPARLPNSDAPFNIGFALGALEHLKPGVYIAMNGRMFLPSNCRKNKTLGRFEQRS